MSKAADQRSLFQLLKKMFFTGMVFIFPIAVTIWLLNLLITKTQGYARPIVENLLGRLLPGVPIDSFSLPITIISLMLVIITIILVGALANFYLGKQILNTVDRIMLKLPFIRTIYGGTKQILDAFSMQRSSGSFKKVVMLEYPLKGSWVLGFVTNEKFDQANQLFGRDFVAVFVPSTPNPTTGFLLYLEPKDVHVLDLDVEEAVKLIVSAGLVVPGKEKNLPKTLAEILAASDPEAKKRFFKTSPS